MSGALRSCFPEFLPECFEFQAIFQGVLRGSISVRRCRPSKCAASHCLPLQHIPLFLGYFAQFARLYACFRGHFSVRVHHYDCIALNKMYHTSLLLFSLRPFALCSLPYGNS
jgi:hypothetical protein